MSTSILKNFEDPLKPEFTEADARRLAVQVYKDLMKDVRSPLLDQLQISDAEFEAAVEADNTGNDVNMGAIPAMEALLAAKIRTINAPLFSPQMVEQRRLAVKQLEEDRAAELAADRRGAAVRRWAPRFGVAGAGLAAVTLIANVARPEIMRALAQNELNEAAIGIASARGEAITAPSGVTLDQTPIRFACVKRGNERDGFYWQPEELGNVFSQETLANPTYGYNVEYRKGGNAELAVADAGWGTTVVFNLEQQEANYPGSYGAIPANALGSDVYVIPTGEFVPDEENITSGEFVTGEKALDGRLIRYVLLGGTGEPACSGTAEADDRKVKMVDATLAHQFPEISLEDFVGHELVAEGGYTDSFEQYELDEWYSRIFYPNLVTSVDRAIREASKQGVSSTHLEELSGFLDERKFEKDMLKMLQYLQVNLEKEVFEEFLEQLRESTPPSISITVDEAYETTSTHNASERSSGARQGWMYIFPSDLNENAIFDGLIRAISSASPEPSWGEMLSGDELKHSHDDLVFDRGIGYFLSHKGSGADSHNPSEALIDFLVERGEIDDVVRFWTFNPDDTLSEEQIAIFKELQLPVPSSRRQKHMYATLMDLGGLDEDATTEEKEIFKDLVETHRRTSGGEIDLEMGAQIIFEKLKLLVD